MLIMYVKTGCPYSARVREAAAGMDIALAERNITQSEAYERELVEKGGKHETPFLVDGEKGVALYDSEAIVRYLRETYSNRA